MEYRRVLAIGDIHGHFNRLLSLFRKIEFDSSKDFLILLGDYIDRGDENMRCLRWAMEMNEKPNVVALRGNHEQMMLYFYLLGTTESKIWLPNGGNATKRELDAWCAREPDALKKVLKFVATLPYYHKMTIVGREYIFCHAGLKPGVPLEEQEEESLLWIREKFYNDYYGDAEVVVGHTPTPYIFPEKYYPIRLDNKITLLDTGSFLPKGRISCIDVISGKIWQSDPDNEISLWWREHR